VIKKYALNIELTSDSLNIDNVEMIPSEDGKYYYYKDIDWLFKERLQINKLDLQDGDIVVVKVENKGEERVKRIHDFVCETLQKQFNKKVEVMTVVEGIELGILKSTYKSNYATEKE
jgi:hypothetical protein